jgi:hypothetical protein
LSEEAKQQVLEIVPACHPTLHLDHMTLAFAPSVDLLVQLPLGKTVTLQVHGVASDDKGQALAVSLPEASGALVSRNAHPHITLSTAHGVPPVYSNTLLASVPATALPGPPLLLLGRVGVALPPRGAIYTQEELQAWLTEQSNATASDPRPSELHLFDFDNTLLLTPGEAQGKAEWFQVRFPATAPLCPLLHSFSPPRPPFLITRVTALAVLVVKATGAPWPHLGWRRFPESLSHALPMHPGPAARLWQRCQARAGRCACAVVTGRITALEPAVRGALARFGIHPDRIFCQPEAEQSTLAHKLATAKALLAEGNYTRLVLYDDDPTILRGFQQLTSELQRDKAGVPSVSTVDAQNCWLADAGTNAGVVSTFLHDAGLLLVDPLEVNARQHAVEWITAQWHQLLVDKGHSPTLTRGVDYAVLPFGKWACSGRWLSVRATAVANGGRLCP